MLSIPSRFVGAPALTRITRAPVQRRCQLNTMRPDRLLSVIPRVALQDNRSRMAHPTRQPLSLSMRVLGLHLLSALLAELRVLFVELAARWAFDHDHPLRFPTELDVSLIQCILNHAAGHSSVGLQLFSCLLRV